MPLRLATAGLFLLAIGCAPAPDSLGGAPSDAKEDLLPPALQGWILSAFSPDTLYLEIDGEEEQFKGYGFVRMVQARPPASGLEDPPAAFVRLYDMGHPVSAFGIYSTMRDPSNEFAAAGAEAFWSGNGWTGFKGRFFFEIKAFERKGKSAAEAKKNALGIARELADRLPGGLVSFPLALGLLNVDGKKPRTEFYSNDGLLGKGELGRTFRCEWALAREKGAAFVSVFSKEGEAELSLLGIVKSGGLPKESAEPGAWLLQRRGPFLLGVFGPKGAAESVMRSLESRAKEAAASAPLDLPPARAGNR
ncbi:MAG: DUF6599 family protein [Planctomycetota bacterium]